MSSYEGGSLAFLQNLRISCHCVTSGDRRQLPFCGPESTVLDKISPSWFLPEPQQRNRFSTEKSVTLKFVFPALGFHLQRSKTQRHSQVKCYLRLNMRGGQAPHPRCFPGYLSDSFERAQGWESQAQILDSTHFFL